MRLFAATGERKRVSFSNSHFLLRSLSSPYAANLRRCQSHASAAWRSDVQDKECPPGREPGAGTASNPQAPAPGSSERALSPACWQESGHKGALMPPRDFQAD